MYEIVIKNIKSGGLAVLKVFDKINIGDEIGWGCDDVGEIAQWKVISCVACV